MSEKLIEKIAKLLAKAEHPNTSDVERDTFLAHADKLMLDNAIEEAEVRARQTPEERRKPVVVSVTLYDASTVYGQKMRLIGGKVASTLGVRMAYDHTTGKSTLVGYSEDVTWTQMLFQTIQASFIGKMSPKWDSSLSLGANLAAYRESGMAWNRIAAVAHRAGAIDEYLSDRGWSAKLKPVYDAWCKETGAEPVTVTRHEAYRHTYAEAFTTRIMARLEDMADARKTGAVGHELVLYSAKEAVDEAFYQEFPHLSPEVHAEAMTKLKAERELEAEKHAAWLASLTPEKRLAHEKKVTAEREKEQRENERYWRQADRKAYDRFDGNGARAGRAAANGVNLSTSEAAKRGTSGELG